MSFKSLLAVAAAAAFAIPAHAQEADAAAKSEAQGAAEMQAATATKAQAEPAADAQTGPAEPVQTEPAEPAEPAADAPTEAQAEPAAGPQTEAPAGGTDGQAAAPAGTGLVAATASDFREGAEVHDTQGALVGTIESVDANGAVITTGSVRAQLPFGSFGRSENGLVISMSKAELEAAAAARSPS